MSNSDDAKGATGKRIPLTEGQLIKTQPKPMRRTGGQLIKTPPKPTKP